MTGVISLFDTHLSSDLQNPPLLYKVRVSLYYCQFAISKIDTGNDGGRVENGSSNELGDTVNAIGYCSSILLTMLLML